ncbi:hypothetical protein A1Q1_04749 [Trichosporon asahii var. asahii CBS 2479]|uniref:Uncharacterized protein n=1 Tax=Trichosporon asahii var. asahii (strain ATCC 90039 / CBS 2479 / JCM 2466 / KCTC 7840 / NBRC 103889/ NCYC 2677 / UAMH 7654) TaxID=1186058 RepID=J6EUX2_TRIAS|nr:hypothetical protein A1Q1_04749 [Trichosporon asahii var. asahii CBS 2479]EJT46572.1 hypothetical protein A1Q1_04749 [Trichosporon asahii var. asahii CBS 2479]
MIQLEVVGPGTLTPGLNKDPVYCVQSESVAELELDRPLLAAYRLSVRHNPLQFRNDSRVAEREYEYADVDCEAESEGEVAAAEPRIAQCRFCHLLDEFETNQGACLVALEQVPFVFEGGAHEVEDLGRVVRGTALAIFSLPLDAMLFAMRDANAFNVGAGWG